MISGAHLILYSQNAEADRAFFRDVLDFPSVDAGRGWLIFALPPTEAAVHPAPQGGKLELYWMTEDVHAAVEMLQSKGVECGPVSEQGWGIVTELALPSGAKLGLYQPKHPVAVTLR